MAGISTPMVLDDQVLARPKAKPRASTGRLGRLAMVVRNMIEAWPDSVYSEAIVETRVLGRKTVFVCDPDLVHQLLVEQAEALRRDDIVLHSLRPALGRGVLTSDGDEWRKQRRTAAPVFRHDRIAAFVPRMIEAAERTRDRWLGEPPSKPVDVLEAMMGTTFDIIVATMLSGESVIDPARFSHAIAAYIEQSTWKMAFVMIGVPSWLPHPGFIRGLRAKAYLRRAVGAVIARRRAAGQSGQDLLGLLLEATDPQTGEPMSSASLVDNLLTFVAAGHETSALTLAWTFCVLAEHPEMEARMLAEIAAAPRLAGTDHADPAALTYVRQVLMESMRLYPAAPLIARQTMKAITIGGVAIPAGRSVQVPVYAIHRHTALWAKPERFDPERFQPELNAKRKRHSYLPFSTGPRVCIGASFAMTELVALLAVLLPAFSFRRVSADRPEALFKVTLRPDGGMPMTITPRRAA